jgi:O-antigen ligase
MILLLFATASRTAFLIFILSLIICVLLYPTKNHIIKIFILSGGTIVLLSIFIYLINNSDNFLIISRLLSAKDDNFSGRQDLWQALIPHFFDHPILGVGETGYLNIGRFTLSHTKTSGNITYGFSPHNVILEVALYTGLIGLTLWMIFWGVLIKKSIQCYKYTKNLMPIVLLVPIVAAITSGQILAAKWAYMIYAYIFAAYVQIQNEDSKLY